VGNVSRNEQFTVDYSKAYILKACEESLKRLQKDTIDYYQLHTARLAHLQEGECLDAMQQLQKEGKIRYWGISLNTFEPLPEANFFIQQQKAVGFQLVLNLINQTAIPVIKNAAKNGFGIIARMPLQFGLLTGKFDHDFSFPDNDHRKNRLTIPVIEAANSALNPVWDLCSKYQCSKTQLALSYILSYPEISTVIPGIRTKTHVQLNTQGLFKLDPKDMVMIEQLGLNELVPVLDLIKQQG
jgi:aryl-alcohol dehydrogenase-like predicted oxidoreductase